LASLNQETLLSPVSTTLDTGIVANFPDSLTPCIDEATIKSFGIHPTRTQHILSLVGNSLRVFGTLFYSPNTRPKASRVENTEKYLSFKESNLFTAFPRLDGYVKKKKRGGARK